MAKLESNRIKNFLGQNIIYMVLIALVIIISVLDPTFLSIQVFRDILLQSATKVIIALGVSFVLITVGTDLSAGRVVGFAAVISASMLQNQDYLRRFYPDLPELPLILPMLIAVVVGILCGQLNGFIVSKLKVPPFIATLGTMVIVYGANSLYFDMEPNDSQPIGGLRSNFTNLGSGSVLSVPIIVIIALVIALIVWVIFNKTRLGKNMYAIGGNKEAAQVSGLTSEKHF